MSCRFAAIDEAAGQDREGVYSLLDEWISSSQITARWTVIYTLLVGHNLPPAERYSRLVKLMTTEPSVFTDAIQEALKDDDKYYRDMAWSVLEILAEPLPGGQRAGLVSSLADAFEAQLLSALADALGKQRNLHQLVLNCLAILYPLEVQPGESLELTGQGLLSHMEKLRSCLSAASSSTLSTLLPEVDAEVQARVGTQVPLGPAKQCIVAIKQMPFLEQATKAQQIREQLRETEAKLHETQTQLANLPKRKGRMDLIGCIAAFFVPSCICYMMFTVGPKVTSSSLVRGIFGDIGLNPKVSRF